MKKLILLILILTSSNFVYAEVFGTAGTLKPGAVMLGVEPEFLFEPTEFQGNFHFGYGLMKRLDWDLRFGIGTNPWYLGSDLEYMFLRHRIVDFSLSVGAHYQDNMYMDITPNFSHRFRMFTVYTGVDFNIRLSGGTAMGLNWFLGTSIPFARDLELIFDFGINASNYYHWISGGIALYI